MKNGYYAASTWIQDTDGKWYYFNLSSHMVTNDTTPDGYYVDASGAWDGQPSSNTEHPQNLGPAFAQNNES